MNNVSLIGRFTADPELRTTQSNISVTNFTIACDRVFKSEDNDADFINIVAWRGTAEFITRYFHKGMKIALTGHIQTRKYTDRDGNNRTVFEVVADNAEFVEKKASEPATNAEKYQQIQQSFVDVELSKDDLPF